MSHCGRNRKGHDFLVVIGYPIVMALGDSLAACKQPNRGFVTLAERSREQQSSPVVVCLRCSGTIRAQWLNKSAFEAILIVLVFSEILHAYPIVLVDPLRGTAIIFIDIHLSKNLNSFSFHSAPSVSAGNKHKYPPPQAHRRGTTMLCGGPPLSISKRTRSTPCSSSVPGESYHLQRSYPLGHHMAPGSSAYATVIPLEPTAAPTIETSYTQVSHQGPILAQTRSWGSGDDADHLVFPCGSVSSDIRSESWKVPLTSYFWNPCFAF